MLTQNAKTITVATNVNAPVQKTWEYFNNPVHVVKWNNASPEWHTPKAENNVKPGGSFNYRMEAKDGSFGFDFCGIYDAVEENKNLAYTLGDGRKVVVDFKEGNNETQVTTTFEPENENPLEMQQQGWQAILDSFKTYTESN